MNSTIAIIGAGGWGTALSIAMARKERKVRLWAYEPYLVETMIATRENPLYLPGARIPESVLISNSIKEVLSPASIVILAVPSHVYRQVFTKMSPLLNANMYFVSATKGIENDTLMRMSEVVVDVLKRRFTPQIAAISGPTFAAEVAQGEPTALVVACPDERLRLVQTDYGNSYYGRLASVKLTPRAEARVDAVPVNRQATAIAATASAIPTERLIRVLLAGGLYDDAINELRFAQRAWGPSTPVDATIAWVHYRKGDLRRAITLMRRAYPQHMTSVGQELPPEILQVIFPLTYWDWIRKYSTPRGLDPYMIAALIAQESTFDPKVRSSANAWGLMQLVPATGRQLARTLGIPRFRTPMLTNPEINIRLGTLYFSRLVEQFGGTYYALASYNAGESRVVRWRAERPGLDQDEFIDDIPFPETQNYVKRILGTAEDYRMLYGKGGGHPIQAAGLAEASGASPAGVGAKAPSTTKARTPAGKKAPVKKTPANKKVR